MYDNFINFTGASIFIDMVLEMLIIPAKWFVYREETEGPDVQ